MPPTGRPAGNRKCERKVGERTSALSKDRGVTRPHSAFSFPMFLVLIIIIII